MQSSSSSLKLLTETRVAQTSSWYHVPHQRNVIPHCLYECSMRWKVLQLMCLKLNHPTIRSISCVTLIQTRTTCSQTVKSINKHRTELKQPFQDNKWWNALEPSYTSPCKIKIKTWVHDVGWWLRSFWGPKPEPNLRLMKLLGWRVKRKQPG